MKPYFDLNDIECREFYEKNPNVHKQTGRIKTEIINEREFFIVTNFSKPNLPTYVECFLKSKIPVTSKQVINFKSFEGNLVSLDLGTNVGERGNITIPLNIPYSVAVDLQDSYYISFKLYNNNNYNRSGKIKVTLK